MSKSKKVITESEFMRITMTKLETKRLNIYTASQNEMLQIIKEQPDEDLKTAYLEMLQGASKHPDQWVWYAIWIIERKDGTKVGDLSFKGFNDDGAVEIGYGILENHQRRGFATEAVETAVAWAFSQPGVRCVEAETEPGNRPSQRVLEKCGFIPSGTVGEEGPRFVKRRMPIS